MKTSIPITDIPFSNIAEKVQAYEAAGFTCLTTQENRHDPFLPLAIAAIASEKLELCTSIATTFSRSPIVAAHLSWDINMASKGRFTLGLGSQVKAHNVRRFSVSWSPPAPRMREYVQAIRAIWDCWQNGSKLDYQGEHYQFSLMTPEFTPPKQQHRMPRIQMAAVGPAMMKVAAEECDGVMLHGFCTRAYLEKVVAPRLEAGLVNKGKSQVDFEVSGGGFVATGATDEELAERYEHVRRKVGFYGSTPSYWPVLECHGLEDLGLKLNAMSKKGQWQAMTQEVPDDVVNLFAAVGRHDQIVNAVRERFGGIVDNVRVPEGTPPDLMQEIARI